MPPLRAPEPAFRRLSFPRERRLVLDTLRLGRNKPMMHGLIEVDVTRPRARLREHQDRTGEKLSFTAFVLACIGRAVAAHPEVHAQRDWLGRLVMFADVDASSLVEVEVDGRKFALAHVFRGVHERDVRDLHRELRSVQQGGRSSLAASAQRGFRLLLVLPAWLRRVLYRLLLASPRRAKRSVGTLLVSAVGMFGDSGGFAMSAPGLHNLSLLVGGIVRRRVTDAGDSGPREYLCLTVSANHELVDGAPLARFASDLVHRLQSVELLDASIEV